jgi:predicted DNA-binding protein YlxM (UPF0122 family)
MNTIKGGKADKMSVEDIAKKFNVSVEKIKVQIKKGVEIALLSMDKPYNIMAEFTY